MNLQELRKLNLECSQELTLSMVEKINNEQSRISNRNCDIPQLGDVVFWGDRKYYITKIFTDSGICHIENYDDIPFISVVNGNTSVSTGGIPGTFYEIILDRLIKSGKEFKMFKSYFNCFTKSSDKKLEGKPEDYLVFYKLEVSSWNIK
ncbi:MAG: DUF4121 family protein [Tissierellales bacterium]|jgi:hypothetical protein|nr:DUF4121 family protein [Tissierellales bacterium]